MDVLKRYLLSHFEQVFVLVILVSIAYINYYVPYKIAFLSFYFIPVLVAAYYLDYRRAILGAFLSIILVSVYFYINPSAFEVSPDPAILALNIFIWGSFLVLMGALIGKLQEKLKTEIIQRVLLKEELTESRDSLTNVTRELIDHNEKLEEEVAKRTEHLHQAKVAIEVHKEKVEEALYATMDPSVVKLIIEKRLRTEKRTLSIMFADLKAFTVYSEERIADVVITELNRFLGIMEDILLSYRAHIDKYVGDGIIAEFGAPMDYEQHGLLSVAAALKMQEAIIQHEFPWQMRIGIATGEAIIGLIGKTRQSYTALGDVVNLANRIQEVCSPGFVTIDEPTYGNVKQFVDAEIKKIQSINAVRDSRLAREIDECVELLDRRPDDLGLLKRTGILLMKGDDPVQAYDYLKKALEMDPYDDRVKVSFAECSMKLEDHQSIRLRGKKDKLHLYEVKGIKNPLEDRSKIPQHLYDAYNEKVMRLVDYPEDLVLPVECLDGSIGHSRVVGFLSFAIAEELDLPDRDRRDILLAGYFCDIGKTIIPYHLLNRTGSLSNKEFEEVKKHCRETVRMLKMMGHENETVFESVLSHHENYDGSGYPDGLAGDDIPVGARIIAVADTYDALTSWRPYRNRWDYSFALSLMEKDTDKGKFDSTIVEALGRLINIPM
jgi:adenylate cyclase